MHKQKSTDFRNFLTIHNIEKCVIKFLLVSNLLTENWRFFVIEIQKLTNSKISKLYLKNNSNLLKFWIHVNFTISNDVWKFQAI